mmetsp:Transcript_30121/g.34591  ORF Transcript_30121/g.34591 Transcript_30121/m.34591 type:complete len:424 (+) Transcript_30121:122-1393(+)
MLSPCFFVTIFRLHIVCMLMSGDFFRYSSFQGEIVIGLVWAKDDKEEEVEDDNKKNDKNDDSDFPSIQPSQSPSRSPTQNPTKRITRRTNSPTVLPTNKEIAIVNTPSPSPPPSPPPSPLPTNTPTNIITNNPSEPTVPFTISEVRLPEITIDIITVVDDIFSFAALLLDDGGDKDGNNSIGNGDIDSSNNNNNREGLNNFFRRFIGDLLVASRVVDSSTLESIDLEIALLPSKDDNEDGGKDSNSANTSLLEKTLDNKESATKFTPMRIVLNGRMFHYVEGTTEGANEDEKNDVLLLGDFMSHTLAVYFSFWSTDEMVSTLSDFGLTNPKITSVSVDGKIILVAVDTSSDASPDGESNNNYVNDGGGGGGTGNLLIVPNDGVSTTSSENIVGRLSSSNAMVHTIEVLLFADLALCLAWTILV